MSEDGDETAEVLTPGWDAIEAALEGLYPGATPKHYGTLIKWRLGGPDPLDGFSAWKRLAPVPHWHIVTFGFSELYQKESDDQEVSGYGFELTFRLGCGAEAEAPPGWVFNFLQNLARYVFETGNIFRDGDWMPANGPIARDEPTQLCSLAFAEDPELGTIATPFGSLQFLQIVGLTKDEELAAKQWQTRQLLEVLRPHLPLLTTDLSRPSLLAFDEVRAAVAAGSARDGSSSGVLYGTLGWTRHKRLLRASISELTIDSFAVREFILLLPLRLPFGRPLRLFGAQRPVIFEPGERDAVLDGEQPKIRLTAPTARALAAALRPVPGTYEIPGLPLRITVLAPPLDGAAG